MYLLVFIPGTLKALPEGRDVVYVNRMVTNSTGKMDNRRQTATCRSPNGFPTLAAATALSPVCVYRAAPHWPSVDSLAPPGGLYGSLPFTIGSHT